MTPAAQVPSWINKGQPKADWPEWLLAHAVGRPEANGTFMVDGKLGRLRVHKGSLVFEYKGEAFVCFPAEAPAMLAELRAADEPVPPKPASGAMHARTKEAEIAPRVDDTDDITRAIRAQNGDPEPVMVAIVAPPAAAAAPPSSPVSRLQGRALAARGSMPSIEWVQLDRLLVDDSYQRSVDTGPSRALITRIGREWDWRLCVPLMVSRRPTGLFVIDGQHRLFGARLRDDVPQLPCCISVYDGPEAEAAMFVAANRERRAMNRLDDFHAAQAGGDAEAIAVAALIESVGFTVSRRTGSAAWAPGEVAFTSSIAKVRRKHGDVIVRDALGAMAQAFPGERLVAGSSVFTAVCRLLITPPADFDRERLFAALRAFDMKGWASFLSGAKGGDDRAQKLRDMLLAAYDDLGKKRAA